MEWKIAARYLDEARHPLARPNIARASEHVDAAPGIRFREKWHLLLVATSIWSNFTAADLKSVESFTVYQLMRNGDY